jgi:hypothetical protein
MDEDGNGTFLEFGQFSICQFLVKVKNALVGGQEKADTKTLWVVQFLSSLFSRVT